MRKFHIFSLMILIASVQVHPAYAQVNRYSTVLLPLDVGEKVGFNGSEWQTQLAIANTSDSSVAVENLRAPSGCGIDPCFGYSVPPHTTLYVDTQVDCGTGGCLGIVDSGRIRDVSFTLRTRDISRQRATWGVTVPVVRDDQLFDRVFSIVDVPNDAQFRATLRLYDTDPTTRPQARIRIYAVDPTPFKAGLPGASPDSLLMEFTPSFTAGVPSLVAAVSQTYVWGIPTLASAARLRIEIVPLDGRKEYWGFVSVTNNETQEVTVLTP